MGESEGTLLGITKGGVGMKYQQKVATIISIYGFK